MLYVTKKKCPSYSVTSLAIWSVTMKRAEQILYKQPVLLILNDIAHSTTLDKTSEMCVPCCRHCSGDDIDAREILTESKWKARAVYVFFFASVFAARRTNVNDFKQVILSRKGIKVVACGGVKAMPNVFMYREKKLIVVSSINPNFCKNINIVQQYLMSILKKRNPLVLRTRCEHTPCAQCLCLPPS